MTVFIVRNKMVSHMDVGQTLEPHPLPVRTSPVEYQHSKILSKRLKNDHAIGSYRLDMITNWYTSFEIPGQFLVRTTP